MSLETLNPFEIAQKQIKSACDKLNADPAVYESIGSIVPCKIRRWDN